MPYFSSVRAINEAAYKAAYNTLNGEQVWFTEEDGHKHRVMRAKTVKGDLYIKPVQPVGDADWIGPCAWGQVTQSRI